MLESAALEPRDRGADDGDPATPQRGPVTVAHPGTAEAHPHPSGRQAKLAVQVAPPEQAGMVEGPDLLDASSTQEAVGDCCRTGVLYLVALDRPATARQPDQALARRGPGVASPQRSPDGGPVEVIGENAGEPAPDPEHRGTGGAAAAAAAMLVAVGAHAHLEAAPRRFLVEPAEMPPG